MHEIPELLRTAGRRMKKTGRYNLPAKNPEDDIEHAWEAMILEQDDFNTVVVGEEGTYTVEEDPDYAFLIDPLDGTSGAMNGEFPWVTTAVTVLEDVDVNGSHVTGRPVGAYIGKVDNGTEFISWRDDAWINGSARYTDVDISDDLPGTVDGAKIRPRDIDSFDELGDGRKGIVSAYGAKPSRKPVRDHFLGELEDVHDRVRIALGGGAYTTASVGWGKKLVGAEPKPTLPTEASGEVFANAMGAASSDIYGNKNDIIKVKIGDEGPERSYNTVVAATDGVLQEALEAVNIEDLEEAYPDEFETYKRTNRL